MTCNTCKFWHPLPGAYDQRGQCRRSPPTAEWAFASAGLAGWPITVLRDEHLLKIGHQKIRPEDLRGPLAALGYRMALTRSATGADA